MQILINSMATWLNYDYFKMNEMIFRKHYLCEFVMSDHEKKLYDLAESYVRDTEIYDKTISSVRNEYGEAVPVMFWQMSAMQHNAREYKSNLLKDNPEFSRSELTRAIRQCHHI